MSTRAKEVGQPTQAQRRATTRRRLIDAALDVFSRNGFHAASLDEIAAGAGVSKGAVYVAKSRVLARLRQIVTDDLLD